MIDTRKEYLAKFKENLLNDMANGMKSSEIPIKYAVEIAWLNELIRKGEKNERPTGLRRIK